MLDDPACSWLNTSLSALLYNIGHQTMAPHPHEVEQNAVPESVDERDSSSKWLESALMIGGPPESESAQLKKLQELQGITDPEAQMAKMLEMTHAFDPLTQSVVDGGSTWFTQCVNNSAQKMAELQPSALEEKTAKFVFDAMLKHAGLADIESSSSIPAELMKCFEAAVEFVTEARSHSETLEEGNAQNILKGIAFRSEFLYSSLMPALRPLSVQVMQCELCLPAVADTD